MAEGHAVELRLGPERIAVGSWDSLTITHDLLAPTSPWTVTLWRAATMSPWPETDLWPLTRVETPVEVLVDGVVQVRGALGRCEVTGSRQGSPLTLSGRDHAAAAQIADAGPAISLRGVTLEDALRMLFDPLSINLTVGALADEARSALAGMRPGAPRSTSSTRRARRRHRVDQFRVKVGEKVWALADQLCRRHGFLLYSAPSGDGVSLVIDRPAYDSPVLYRLTRKRQADGSYEGTILSGGRAVDSSQVPTAVTVFGHSAIASSADAKLRAEVENEGLVHPRVADAFAVRPRYLRDDKARTPDVCRQRARREIARAMAGFDVCTYTVQGWKQSGRLFAINAMAHIDDDLTGVHGDWLVTQVTMNRSRSAGHTATLRLVPKGALVIEPDPDV